MVEDVLNYKVYHGCWQIWSWQVKGMFGASSSSAFSSFVKFFVKLVAFLECNTTKECLQDSQFECLSNWGYAHCQSFTQTQTQRQGTTFQEENVHGYRNSYYVLLYIYAECRKMDVWSLMRGHRVSSLVVEEPTGATLGTIINWRGGSAQQWAWGYHQTQEHQNIIEFLVSRPLTGESIMLDVFFCLF